MNTCDTCNYWKPSYPHSPDHKCTHPKIGFMAENNEQDAARLEYDEIHILTGPKFGCIHWEPK